MAVIRVTPDHLRQLGGRFQDAAPAIDAMGSRASGAFDGLDWEARQRAGIAGEVGQARNLAHKLAQQSESLARFLSAKAQAFDEADRLGVQGISDLGRTFADSHSALNKPVVLNGAGTAMASVAAGVGGALPVGSVVLSRLLGSLASSSTSFDALQTTLHGARALNTLDFFNGVALSGFEEGSLTAIDHADWVMLPLAGAIEYARAGDYTWHGAAVAGLTVGLPALGTIGLSILCPPAGAIAVGVQMADPLLVADGSQLAAGIQDQGWRTRANTLVDWLDLHRDERALAETLVDNATPQHLADLAALTPLGVLPLNLLSVAVTHQTDIATASADLLQRFGL